MDGSNRLFMEATVAKFIYLDDEGVLIGALSRSCGFRQIYNWGLDYHDEEYNDKIKSKILENNGDKTWSSVSNST